MICPSTLTWLTATITGKPPSIKRTIDSTARASSVVVMYSKCSDGKWTSSHHFMFLCALRICTGRFVPSLMSFQIASMSRSAARVLCLTTVCSRYVAIILRQVDWHVIPVGWAKYGTGMILLRPGIEPPASMDSPSRALSAQHDPLVSEAVDELRRRVCSSARQCCIPLSLCCGVFAVARLLIVHPVRDRCGLQSVHQRHRRLLQVGDRLF